MKLKISFRSVLPALFAIAFAACTDRLEVTTAPSGEEMSAEEVALAAYEPGVAVLKLSEELSSLVGAELESGMLITKSLPLNDFVDYYGVTSFRRVFSDDERFRERHQREGLDRWFYVEFDSERAASTRASEQMALVDGVELAHPVRKIKRMAFDDPRYSSQWHLNQASGMSINVEEVWSSFTTGSSTVRIAVVDGGIDPGHEDLQVNYNKTLSRNFVTGGAVNADNHGTHVGGIIAATSNNGTGVAGVAGGDAAKGLSGVEIISCQVFSPSGSGGGFEDAIRYGADNGAVISQNSWGYNFDYNDDGQVTGSEYDALMAASTESALKAAIGYFIKYAGCDNDGNQLPDSPMKGGLVVFAAGNDDLEKGLPGYDCDNVLSVGSTTKDGARSSFSNYGDWVDICAPGSSIMSTLPSGSYGSMSGTSMACPVVSGVAGLVVSVKGGMGFTNEMLWDCLVNSAIPDKIHSSGRNIGPFVDALGAVSFGTETAPEDISGFEVSVSSNYITLGWEVPAKENGRAAYGALLCASTNRASIENLDPKKPADDVVTASVMTSSNAVGEKVSGTLSGLDFEKEYYVTVVPYNYGPVYASVPAAKQVTTGANNAPVITSDVPEGELVLKASETRSFNFSVSEPDGHEMTVRHTAGSTAAERWASGGSGQYVLTIDAVSADAGKYEALVSAKDAFGLSTEFRLSYEVLENRKPEVVGNMSNLLMSPDDATLEIPLGGYFSDPDGDLLEYEVSGGTGITVHATVSGGSLFVSPRTLGRVELTVAAKDPRSARASQTVVAVVRAKDETMSVYPTQVSGMLYIGAGEEEEQISVKIVALGGGAVVYEQTVKSSVFNPLSVDMSGMAPGRYSVSVVYKGETIVRNIVKI